MTRARLRLLGLFYRRCEERLRGRLEERARQQVLDEAAVDVEVHRQMRPADTDRGRGAHGRSKAGSDGASQLLGTVAKLRLGSALEELAARSVHPVVRRRLLEALLVKVCALNKPIVPFVGMYVISEWSLLNRREYGGKYRFGCHKSALLVVRRADSVSPRYVCCTLSCMGFGTTAARQISYDFAISARRHIQVTIIVTSSRGSTVGVYPL